MAQKQFAEEDVLRVASAIGNGVERDAGGRNDYLVCVHCGAREYYKGYDQVDVQIAKFEHDASCVVLVARDLLS